LPSGAGEESGERGWAELVDGDGWRELAACEVAVGLFAPGGAGWPQTRENSSLDP
jgi:hypothetical protein